MRTEQKSEHEKDIAFVDMCSGENYFSRSEIEKVSDEVIMMTVTSQEFDLMEPNERSNVITYLIAAKRSMYRTHFIDE